MKSTAGAAAGAGLPRNADSGCDLVAGLDLLDVVDVAGIEELRAVEHERELRFGADHRLDASGFSPFQFGPASR